MLYVCNFKKEKTKIIIGLPKSGVKIRYILRKLHMYFILPSSQRTCILKISQNVQEFELFIAAIPANCYHN